MPLIPYPDVPLVEGVPPLARIGPAATDALIALGTVQNLLASALQAQTQWGIFDATTGNQLGVSSQSNNLAVSLLTSALGQTGPVLSTNAFEFTGDSRISTFPVQKGGFATYNKVVLPTTPTVTLALTGSPSDRTAFINQIELARKSVTLYNIVTPEITYYKYAFGKYSQTRRVDKGATLFMVEIGLVEVREISAAYSTVQTPINQPQNPASTPASNSGIVQPQQPSSSVLNSVMTKLF